MTAVRSSSANNAATGSDVNTALPTGTADGDVVVVLCMHNGVGPDFTDNNGARPFTEDMDEDMSEPGSEGANFNWAVYSRRLVSGDAAALASAGLHFTHGSSDYWACIAVAIQDPHASVIWDVTPQKANALIRSSLQSSISVPAITTNNDNAVVLAACGVDGVSSTVDSTPGAPWSDVQVTNRLGMSTKVQATAGSTGTAAFTHTSEFDAGLQFAIRAAPGGISIPLMGANLGKDLFGGLIR